MPHSKPRDRSNPNGRRPAAGSAAQSDDFSQVAAGRGAGGTAWISRPGVPLALAAYALAGAAVVIAIAWLAFLRLRLEMALPWTAVGLAGIGFVLAVVAFAKRRTEREPAHVGPFVGAFAVTALVASVLAAFATYGLALPGRGTPPPRGTAIAAFPQPLTAVTAEPDATFDGRAIDTHALRGRPAVITFYRGHW